MHIPYRLHVLDNGLRVVVHEDRSDPVVSVWVYYHVGSAREAVGKSGFAHLFEHMLFQGSANVADEEHFRYVQEAGGAANGNTTSDRTAYYETLPANELELALWLESDRMGFLLPALTQEKLDRQREVVMEERRQNYENRPYGLAHELLLKHLFPVGHPYSWPTIGSMDDIARASLEDVEAFFRRWYGPNNATLVIAGDVDPQEALELARGWFGGIPRGPEVPRAAAWNVSLAAEKRVVMEDRVSVPQLSLTWPGVGLRHPDDAPLDLLVRVLSATRASVLDKALSIDERLASTVTAGWSARELAGTFQVVLRPHEGVSLDRLHERTLEVLRELDAKGVSEEQLERVKTSYEAGFVRALELVESRARLLGFYDVLAGSPGALAEALERRRAVTTEDVERVLREVLVDRPHVAVSVVPKGRADLALWGSRSDEELAHDARELHANVRALPRAARPVAGTPPAFHTPPVWHDRAPNGLHVVGARFDEVPLASVALSLPAGDLRVSVERAGLASLTVEMLQEGTRALTSTGLVEELEGHGIRLACTCGREDVRVEVSALERVLPRACDLLADVVLEPRFDAEDFERVRAERLRRIEAAADNARAVAAMAWGGLLFGPRSNAGAPTLGTAESVAALSVEDVRAYWAAHAAAGEARASFVGADEAARVRALLGPLASAWEGAAPAALGRVDVRPLEPGAPRLFVVDMPGAPQCELRVGHRGVASGDPDFYPFFVLNYALGGSFSSRINLNLREDKGYTYGARSSVGGGPQPAPFTVSTAVRTEVAGAALREILGELRGVRDGLEQRELDLARDALLRSGARQYESMRALSGLAENIARYGWSDRYPEERRAQLQALTLADMTRQARERVDPDGAYVLVVGDAERARPGLLELGLGEPVELDRLGAPVA